MFLYLYSTLPIFNPASGTNACRESASITNILRTFLFLTARRHFCFNTFPKISAEKGHREHRGFQHRNKFAMVQRWLQPALVKLSHGSLPLPADIKVEKENASQLQFSRDPVRIEDGHSVYLGAIVTG